MNRELLAAVLAYPQDDLPRLLLADWLAEHAGTWRDDGKFGQRADAIRFGVARPATEISYTYSEEFGGPTWGIAGPGKCDFPPPPRQRIVGAVFCARRGLLAAVRLRLADWLQHGPAVVREHPVTEVRLTDWEPRPTIRRGQRTGSWGLYIGVAPATYPSGRVRTFAGPESGIVHKLSGRSGGGWALYESADAARADLSAACLSWAKDQKLTEVET